MQIQTTGALLAVVESFVYPGDDRFDVTAFVAAHRTVAAAHPATP